MFPPEEESVIDIDAAVDTVVLKVSQDLINDIPAGDPRWMEMRVPGMLKEYSDTSANEDDSFRNHIR
jgi:hypothetical protein